MDDQTIPHRIDLTRIFQSGQRPEPFTPGDHLIWQDDHVNRQLLDVHLDPETHAASRPPGLIEAEVAWMIERVGLQAGQSVLDLGCGPGLYSIRLARRGLRMTGIDFSRPSIEYARQQAVSEDLPIVYCFSNFTTIEYDACFDMVMQINGEINIFSPQKRDDLLTRIYTALKPGGALVCDLTTPVLREKHQTAKRWYTAEGGFFHGRDHLVLEQGFAYEDRITCDQFIVIKDDGQITVYRNWFQDHTPDTIRPVLEKIGFTVEGMYGNLRGERYTDESEWVGIVARKSG